ncbi:MAG: dTDP-glucose 4,6-dehydratase [Candidatus Magasanikbacteria bacterium]|nr:dTDP-glucose 4,6-dehydratase [Candidatus Magasanikbacteria bacterium]
MKILVTGGAGFIGSNFIHYVLANHPEDIIINFDALTYAGNLANLAAVAQNPRYSFFKADITDAAAVSEAVALAPDAIVNFAAETHVDRSIMDSSAFVKTNVLGVQILLEAARQAGNIRFHHISTDEVFGSLLPHDPPFNENTPYAPRSPYSASKAAADLLVRAYFTTYNLPVTISNCSNNYGPYQFPEKLHGLFITNLLENKKVPVYGDGLQIRDWLYATDHCEAIDLILRRGRLGESYCIGGASEKTNLAIAEHLLKLLNLDQSYIQHVADRPGHDRRYALNFDKLKNELGWEPKTSFADGMQKTVAWYKANTDWWQKIKSGEYQEYYKKQYPQK